MQNNFLIYLFLLINFTRAAYAGATDPIVNAMDMAKQNIEKVGTTQENLSSQYQKYMNEKIGDFGDLNSDAKKMRKLEKNKQRLERIKEQTTATKEELERLQERAEKTQQHISEVKASANQIISEAEAAEKEIKSTKEDIKQIKNQGKDINTTIDVQKEAILPSSQTATVINQTATNSSDNLTTDVNKIPSTSELNTDISASEVWQNSKTSNISSETPTLSTNLSIEEQIVGTNPNVNNNWGGQNE